MTREFSDELLSAYLDGELSPAERAAVDQHLAGSAGDRELLADLKSLRRDMAALPQANVDSGFTDRVVQAALAAAAPAKAEVSLAPPVAIKVRRNRMRPSIAVATTAATIAACLVLYWQPWQTTSRPLSPTERIVTALHSAIPVGEQAVVLRLQIPKEVSAEAIDNFLRDAGIEQTQGGDSKLDEALAFEYQKSQTGARDLASSAALFVEAPLGQLQMALVALASTSSARVDLAHEGHLKYDVGESEPEGTSNNSSRHRSFVQHLDASLFQLERRSVAPGAHRQTKVAPNDQSHVQMRVLILVEHVDTE